MSKIVLINSFDDFAQLKKNFSSCEMYASNYFLYLKLKDKGVKYLYPTSRQTSVDLENFHHLTRNWYRDDDGKDLFFINGLSFPVIIRRSLCAYFGNDYRNYIAVTRLLKRYNYVYISDKAEKSFLNIKEVIPGKIRFYKSNYEADIPFTSSPQRTAIGEYPKRKKLSFVARLLQIPFKYLLRNRILVWPDWTYKSVIKNRRDSLYMNSLKPLKAFYIIKNRKYQDDAETIFPDKIDEDILCPKRLINNIGVGRFSEDIILIELFINALIGLYDKSYANLRSAYNSIMDAFIFYSPEKVILPGETSFEHLITLSIAKQLKVKSIHILDGFPILNDKSIENMNESGKILQFSRYVGYGKAGYKHYIDIRKIPKQKVLIAQTPLASKSTVGENKDILIMAYYPNQHNPEARWDMRFKIAYEVIKLLDESNQESIALKIKDGPGSKKEAAMYRLFFKILGLDIPLKIIEGESFDSIKAARYVIGQASSAIFECAILNIPFYLYEPNEAGTPKNYLLSHLGDLQNASKTIDQLKKSISAKKSIEYIKHEYLIEGPKLDKIEFD